MHFFPVVSEKRPVLQSHPTAEIPRDTNLPTQAQVQDQTLAEKKNNNKKKNASLWALSWWLET